MSAQQPGNTPVAERVTVFQNVRIFDGAGSTLSAPANVLVRGNKIAQISNDLIDVGKTPNVTIIDGKGRVLMPGLIDAHWHTMMAPVTITQGLTAGIGYLSLVAGREAEATLMRGFTTVRDMAGPAFDIKRAIDEGVIAGPRIYPSGAAISQTSGHADFRMPYEIPRVIGGPLTHTELNGYAAIADSPDEVRVRAREQLRMGASQLKLTAGGGIASSYDPIDTTQYTEAEIRAAVEAAENWGTYVTVHAYTPRAIRTAIAAGVKCIEHGQLLDEPTAKLMAEKGIWLSLQPFLNDQDANFPADPALVAKQMEVIAGTDTAYGLAKKYHLKVAWGTDIVFEPQLTQRQGADLAKLVRWYTPAEVLKMATADNAELLALSGPRNPYPGKLGVVQEGALADLLLVEGNPLENLKIVEDPAKNFVVIMKDGKIYKNLLGE
jgi:imidazolonepropionase-like amidohydrolase